MKFSTIEKETVERICFITLNRPEKKNALNGQVVKELTQAFSEAAEDSKVKVIVLRARGDVFSAGADLDYLQQLQKNSYEENLADSRARGHLLNLIFTLPKIVIAQVEGHAIAGGCGLVSVCDIVVASDAAKFGYTEVKIGFIPALVSVFLLKKIPGAAVRKLFFTGNLIGAQEAHSMGLVSEIAEHHLAELKAIQIAEDMVANSSAESLKATKNLLTVIGKMNPDEALNYAAEQNAAMRASEDCRKGIAFFLKKEKINW